MKRYFIVVFFLVTALNVLAYPFDVIITKSREQVQCIILSRTEEQITYRNLDDTIQSFTLNTSEVEKVYSRDNGPVIWYVPEPEPLPVVKKEVEILIEPKEEPVRDEKVEPIIATNKESEIQAQELKEDSVLKPLEENQKEVIVFESEQKPSQEEKPQISTEDELKYKLFMSTIKGPNMEQYRAKKKEQTRKENILKQNIISIFVIGLDDSQADIQEVIESEVLSKLSTIKGHNAQIETVAKGIPEDSIIVIAKDSLSKYALIITARPFQKQYYLQSKFVNVTNGEHLVSARAASSLISLDDVLKASDELTDPVVGYFQKQKEEEDAELQAWIEESDKQTAKKKEEEERQNTQMVVDDTQDRMFEQLQESTQQLLQTFGGQNAVDNTFTLIIVNPKSYPCRVVLAGRRIGIVNPRTTQRFKVSLALYGKVQIIQNSGYVLYPSETTYIIPKQSSKSALTLRMD
jgi:hypothetical protein